jgi:hypothetical protein
MEYFRVYKSGKRSEIFDIKEDEIADLIKFNDRYAHFVDGKCVCPGGLTEEEIVEAKKKYLNRL